MDKGQILKFAPNIHTALWGCESWEISPHRSSPSIVLEAFPRGQTPGERGQTPAEKRGQSLAEAVGDYPLLVKVIDARTRLSVQVHPNETTCRVTGGDPKTEMWVMLEDGVIFAGLRPGTDPGDVESAVRSGRFEDLLVRHEARKGEAFFIPGGLVHAIGDRTLLYEVQQSSDTTFRLYDWGRVGADGLPRELHVEKSLQAIDYSLPPPRPVKDISCPFFDFRQFDLDGDLVLPSSESCTALFAAEGAFTVNGVEVPSRTSVLATGGAPLALSGHAHVFATTVPNCP